MGGMGFEGRGEDVGGVEIEVVECRVESGRLKYFDVELVNLGNLA